MRAGDIIASKYELVSRVGQGGMGSVWRVAHRSTGREFAIKFLHAAVAASEDSRQRFLQEAKASARINHPNIIDIFDVGETEDGMLYLVMELLDGISLGEALRSEPPFSARDLLLVLAEVCTALTAAHAAGVIHRDVKPPNIFLHRDRGTGFVTAKVLDFGVSKVLSGDDGVSTHTGSLLGSPRYMSPEQAHSAASADGRSDIWSMGVVLFEGLTGRFPHDGDSSNSLIVAIATKPPKLLQTVAPQLPASLLRLVDDCLKPQNERIATTENLLDRILVILSTEDLTDLPLARPTVAKGKSRIRPESFNLRTSPDAIPGLATSMMRARARSPNTRSGELVANENQMQQKLVSDRGPKAPSRAPEIEGRPSAGDFSFGHTSTADTPRMPGRGATPELTQGDDATLVNFVDPSTNTYRRPATEPSPRTELMPQAMGAGRKDTVRLGDSAPIVAAIEARRAQDGAPDYHPVGQGFDPTVESISSINVARGPSTMHPEVSLSLGAPFVSGAAKRTQALWVLLAGVAVLTVVVTTLLVMSYSSSGPRASAGQPSASEPAAPVEKSAATTSASNAPVVTLAPSAAPSSSSSPTTSVSALPAASHGKPPVIGGGRRPAKPGDPIKDLGSGLN